MILDTVTEMCAPHFWLTDASSLYSIVVRLPNRVFHRNLAKIPPKQVMIDFGRGSCLLSESERCPAGIVERFEKFKMASKMAATNYAYFKCVIKSLFFKQMCHVIQQKVCFCYKGFHLLPKKYSRTNIFQDGRQDGRHRKRIFQICHQISICPPNMTYNTSKSMFLWSRILFMSTEM